VAVGLVLVDPPVAHQLILVPEASLWRSCVLPHSRGSNASTQPENRWAH
jgi:hypothetical protein